MNDNAPLVVIIPIYDDWIAARQTLQEIDQAVKCHAIPFPLEVLLVDDASPTALEHPDDLNYEVIRRIRTLHLRRNLGHQRAIAIGLAYAYHHLSYRAILVMDGDGEDKPQDIPRLVEKLLETDERQVVFAERARRSEGLLFTAFYHFYRLLHVSLTSIKVRFGNFCILPPKPVAALMVSADLWNNFSATIVKSRTPYTSIPTHRGNRYAGKSKMNFTGLVLHGLSAFSVHGEIIGIRMSLMIGGISFLIALALAFVFIAPLFSALTIPDWASTVGKVLLVLLTQAGLLTIASSMFALKARSNLGFMPLRDYVLFYESIEDVFPRNS